MLLTLLLFFVGFYILIKGANLLVDGASSLAQKLKISGLVIGLVIVGIGTSIPEFSIMFLANFLGEESIGLGTIIGSNTFNILFILGISALFFPFQLKRSWVQRDLLWNIFAVLITIVFGFSFLRGSFLPGEISRLDGLVMILLFVLWLYIAIKKSNETEAEEKSIRILALPMALVMVLAGLVGTILGGKWVVDGAALIARSWGVSETLIGLTIVSIGTSLPELVTTFVAAFKRQTGIAVGGIVGSNIFDFFMILGVGALMKPVDFASVHLLDIAVTLFSAVLLYAAMFIGKRYILKRWQGLIFIAMYIVYVFYLINRG